MTKIIIVAFAVITLVFAASTAQTQVTDVKWAWDTSAFADHVVNTLTASFDGQYTGAQLRIDLTGGSVYQHPSGSALPPNQAFVDVFAELGYDTFLGQGSNRAGGSNGEPSPGGGAVDLGGAAIAVFSDSMINQAWNPAGGVNISDQSDFFLAQVTLSDDAFGTAHVLVSAAGSPTTLRDIPIWGGVIGFPEPATMLMAGLGVLGIATIRRR